MKKIRMLFFVSLVIYIALLGCKRNDPQNSDLFQKWTLTSVQNTKSSMIINYPDTTTLVETIAFTDTALLIDGSCGNYGQAHYSIKNDTINFTKISIFNLLYCDLYQWEEYVIANLDSAYRYTINGSQLKIYSKGSQNLIFRPNTSK
jgi:heat shock protein HslJ